MITANVKDFTKGWMIGDFEPSVLRTNCFEFARQFHPKGFVGQRHVHDQSTEYNYIASGRLLASGKELSKGDMFIYAPGEVSEVTFLEDTDTIIIRTPSIPTDKRLVEDVIP